MTRITFALAFVARWTEVSGVFQVAGISIAGRSGVIRLPKSALVSIARGTGITGSARVALISGARRTGVREPFRVALISIAGPDLNNLDNHSPEDRRVVFLLDAHLA